MSPGLKVCGDILETRCPLVLAAFFRLLESEQTSNLNNLNTSDISLIYYVYSTTLCQENLTFRKARNRGHIGGDMLEPDRCP
jgi:hypothetical protein